MSPLDFQRSLPMKRMGAGALLFDGAGRLLIVKPSYKPGWEIPGGVVEANESPAQACRREIHEELGIDVQPTGLLCVDYNTSTPNYLESLMFLFAAPVLTEGDVASIRVDGDEIVAARFCEPSEAITLLGPRLEARVQAVLDTTNHSTYVEDQQPLSTLP